MLASELASLVRDVVDFPKPGVLFKDVTPLLAHPDGLRSAADLLAAPWIGKGITKVVGIEARGFLFAPMIAERLGAGMVPLRKPGKLPWQSHMVEYDLEYGTDRLEVHVDSVGPSDRVIVVDDVLATGGTAMAAARLLTATEAQLVGYSFLLEIAALGGRSMLSGALADGVQISSVVTYA